MQASLALKFPRGAMYRIICRSNQYALTIADKVNHKNSRIYGEFQNPQDIAQLWFIDQIKNADYEIVNALSSFCFDEQKGEIKLKKGGWKDDQLFALEKISGQSYYQWYLIKTEAKGDIVVTLDGVLKYKKLQPNNQTQMFRFQPFIANQEISKTSIVTNTFSGKVIDVPQASRKEGQKIIQYSKNRRFNQRWVFQKINDGIVIQNFNSKLVLDIEGEKKKPGTSVIQWQQTNKTNQLWKLQDKGNNNFVIRPLLEPKLFLSIENNSINDGQRLVIDKTLTIWHIQGKLPPHIVNK